MNPGFPLLTSMIFLPAAGAVVVALVPTAREDVAKLIAITVAVAEAALAIFLLIQFDKSQAGFQFVTKQTWISDFGISWHLGVDGISLFLVVLTAILFPLSMAGPKIHAQPKAFMAWMLLLEAACIGAFVALDLFVFCHVRGHPGADVLPDLGLGP